MIIPETTLNTSSEMPKMLKTLSPTSAEPINMIRMLRATLAASRRRSGAVKFGVRVRKSEPQTTGLMTAKTVTIACRTWWRLVWSRDHKFQGIIRS